MVTAWPRLHFLMAKKGQVRLAVANFGQGFPAMKKEPQYGGLLFNGKPNASHLHFCPTSPPVSFRKPPPGQVRYWDRWHL